MHIPGGLEQGVAYALRRRRQLRVALEVDAERALSRRPTCAAIQLPPAFRQDREGRLDARVDATPCRA